MTMKCKIIDVNWNFEVQNCIRNTNYKIVRILEMDSDLFETLINCSIDKRLIIINNILENEDNHTNWE